MTTKFEKLRAQAESAIKELQFFSVRHPEKLFGKAVQTEEVKGVAHLKIDYSATVGTAWSAESLRAAADWLDELNSIKTKKKSFFGRKK